MEKTNTLHDENLCVAEYLSAQIAICGLSQIQIADQMGLSRANVITMIKQGKTRLPIPRVPGLAKALGVDAASLMCRVLREYQPEILETWKIHSDWSSQRTKRN